jgi:predicted AAA+ superfamily ATPase
VSLLGPRQVGKTTLARMIAEEHTPVHFFDLENPVDVSRLREPLTALEPLSGLIVINPT